MSDAGYATFMPVEADGSEFQRIQFIAKSIMNGMITTAVVKVIAVHVTGNLKIGTVDVQPAINQTDNAMTGYAHGTIYGLPYSRVQGGVNAIICDPAVGDMGFIVCAINDISVAKATQDIANPGSRRKFDWADGIYVGACIPTVTPTRYIEFMTNGIKITGPSGDTITVQADTVNVISNAVNLGGTGGAKVARVGDSVQVGSSTGTITSGSSRVSAT